ncbi:hypothetical protein ACRAWG_31215 [Methylobacterium sp. P31]
MDYCGVLMIGAEPVRGAEGSRILCERTAAYRNRPGQQWGAPVWAFAVRGG